MCDSKARKIKVAEPTKPSSKLFNNTTTSFNDRRHQTIDNRCLI